jgi:hypothetical protein
MKLIKTICPHCGAPLQVDSKAQKAICEYCGMTTLIESNKQPTMEIDSEREGYLFEKGRLRAQSEHVQKPIVRQIQYEVVPAQKKKRHTFWWVMGWIFIFPIPATILIVRSKKMHWILKTVLILLVWGIYIAIGMSGSKNA